MRERCYSGGSLTRTTAEQQLADRTLKLRVLRKTLTRYGAWEDSSRGNGSHTMFFRNVGGSVFSYPIPTHGTDVLQCYVRNIRKKFKLTEADGVTDAEFYE